MTEQDGVGAVARVLLGNSRTPESSHVTNAAFPVTIHVSVTELIQTHLINKEMTLMWQSLVYRRFFLACEWFLSPSIAADPKI